MTDAENARNDGQWDAEHEDVLRSQTYVPNPIEDAERHFADGNYVPFPARMARMAREAGRLNEAAYWDDYSVRLWELNHNITFVPIDHDGPDMTGYPWGRDQNAQPDN